MKIRLTGALALAVLAISAPLASATPDSEPILPVDVKICLITITTSEAAPDATVRVSVSESALLGYTLHLEGDKGAGDVRLELEAGSDCVKLRPGPPAGE